VNSVTETKYDREKRQVDEALATLPKLFRLRAFPEMEMRAADRLAHFVLHGEVQVVVEGRICNATDAPFQQFGRDSLAKVQHEIIEVLEQ
jgi:hypothetical protein